ncbi:MAG: M1 family aminopeptidase [Myxococcota bacterium]
MKSTLLTMTFLLVTALAHAGADVTQQDITADITGTALVLDVQIQVQSVGDTTSLVMFRPTLPTEVDVDGTAVTLTPHPEYPAQLSVLTFPTPLTDGQEATVHLAMNGVPACGSVGSLACLHNATETVLLPSGVDMAWHYTGLFDVDTFLASVTVKAPTGKHVVAGQGAPASVVDNGDDTRTWTFQAAVPTESLTLYARAADEMRSPGNKVVGYLVGNTRAHENMTRAVSLAEDLLPVYGALFRELPVDEVHLMMVSPGFPFGGMGLLGNIFMGDYILDTHDYLLEQGVAHELGHSWWGNLARAVVPEEGLVLQEGLAEYSAWRALGQLQGDDVRTSGVRMNAVWYMFRRPQNRDVAPLDPDIQSSSVAIFAGYHKASTVFRTFEEIVGEEAFTRALSALTQPGATLSITSLVDEVARTSGTDLTPEVDQWLRHTGYPAVVLTTHSAPSATGGVDVTVEVDSRGAFTFTLPLELRLPDGTVIHETVLVPEDISTHTLHLPAAPLLVQADPRWTLVRDVDPLVFADVTLDGAVDAADLVEIALRSGGHLPETRREDGRYDPLYDVNEDETIDELDLEDALAAVR